MEKVNCLWYNGGEIRRLIKKKHNTSGAEYRYRGWPPHWHGAFKAPVSCPQAFDRWGSQASGLIPENLWLQSFSSRCQGSHLLVNTFTVFPPLSPTFLNNYIVLCSLDFNCNHSHSTTIYHQTPLPWIESGRQIFQIAPLRAVC